jgi:hypothetical protein
MTSARARGAGWGGGRQAALGMSLLVGGTLVYVLARPAGSTAFLPRGVGGHARPPEALTVLLGSLPTFLHTLAFALMTLAVLRPGPRGTVRVCGAWLLLEAAFEVAQHPAIGAATGLGGDPRDALATAAPLAWLRDYCSNGTFDVADLVAAFLGAALACALARGRAK